MTGAAMIAKVKMVFLADEDGAVTVDWVVLTASIVVVGIAAVAILQPGVYEAASYIDSGVRSSTNF